jgi:hypothetical protein
MNQKDALATVNAEAIGMLDLYAAIKNDLALANDPNGFTPTAGMIYQRIWDAVIDCPEETFGDMMDVVRCEFGFRRDEFFAKFRRCRETYEKAASVAPDFAGKLAYPITQISWIRTRYYSKCQP